jgi:HPt (histidine-containing phosphotransfer) domain-containing protein
MPEAAIDLATYRELQQAAGADFVVELIETFLEEAPQMLAELRAARSAAHAERFRRAAHSLKSNGHTFGALHLAALARELELKGLNADPHRDAAAIDAIDAAFADAASALQELGRG